MCLYTCIRCPFEKKHQITLSPLIFWFWLTLYFYLPSSYFLPLGISSISSVSTHTQLQSLHQHCSSSHISSDSAEVMIKTMQCSVAYKKVCRSLSVAVRCSIRSDQTIFCRGSSSFVFFPPPLYILCRQGTNIIIVTSPTPSLSQERVVFHTRLFLYSSIYVCIGSRNVCT